MSPCLFDYLSRAEQVERWENVLRVLENMPEHERKNHWDMGTWARKTECGTIACAAGHCALDPWFQERGFNMRFEPCSCGCSRINADIDSPEQFFGSVGSKRIFYNTLPRSVGVVIEEVKGYLEELRA